MRIAIAFRALNDLFEKVYPLANSHIKSMLLKPDYIELEMDIDINVDYVKRLTFDTLRQCVIVSYDSIIESDNVSTCDMTIGDKKIHVRIVHCRPNENNRALDYSFVTMSTDLSIEELAEFITTYNE